MVDATADRREARMVWCSTCRRFVELYGWVHSPRRDAPVHLTPAEWADQHEHDREGQQ